MARNINTKGVTARVQRVYECIRKSKGTRIALVTDIYEGRKTKNTIGVQRALGSCRNFKFPFLLRSKIINIDVAVNGTINRLMKNVKDVIAHPRISLGAGACMGSAGKPYR
jgi:hypothetical protein